MLRKIIITLMFLNLLFVSILPSKETKSKISLGIYVGNLTIPGNRYLDYGSDWPSPKYGILWSYKLNRYSTVQLESGFAKSSKHYQYSQGSMITPIKKETLFKEFSVIDASFIINTALNPKVSFFIGPGVGYKKIEQSTKDDYYSDQSLKYSGLTLHYLIGSDFCIRPDSFCIYFQFKQKIGITDFKFLQEPIQNYESITREGQMSLSGFEIILGLKIFI